MIWESKIWKFSSFIWFHWFLKRSWSTNASSSLIVFRLPSQSLKNRLTRYFEMMWHQPSNQSDMNYQTLYENYTKIHLTWKTDDLNVTRIDVQVWSHGNLHWQSTTMNHIIGNQWIWQRNIDSSISQRPTEIITQLTGNPQNMRLLEWFFTSNWLCDLWGKTTKTRPAEKALKSQISYKVKNSAWRRCKCKMTQINWWKVIHT